MFADVSKSGISFIMKTHILVKLKSRCQNLVLVSATVMIELPANFGHVIDHSALEITFIRVQFWIYMITIKTTNLLEEIKVSNILYNTKEDMHYQRGEII